MNASSTTERKNINMTLADLTLKPAYHKPEDDIAEEFYLPCLARAQRYDRAVGFFSSAIYALAWPSLKAFVDRGGRIRLICSPVLSTTDVTAITDGYAARSDLTHAEMLRNEFSKLLNTPGTIKPAKVLAALVALGVVDFRIAWVGDNAGGKPKRLFHDKVGIFWDEAGEAVVFKGSMNETWPGLARDGNLESVDVYTSWTGSRERERIEAEQRYFDQLWAGSYADVTTVPLPTVVLEDIIEAADTEHWRELVEEIDVEISGISKWSPDPRPGGRVPYPHQIRALEAWRARGRRGILEHATGSGKTFTALCAIDEALEKRETVLILVPSGLLLRQWTEELRLTFENRGPRVLLCGAGHSEWRSNNMVSRWTRQPGPPARVVLATLQTASTPQFINACRAGQHLLLVTDEVHRVGAPQARNVLVLDSGPRLGLSATPERAGDPFGTRAILSYFGGIVPPPFTLFDAISSGTLTPYAYHVHSISLQEDEQACWDEFTKEIRLVYAQTKDDDRDATHEHLKRLLISRARIVKSAYQKIDKAVSLISGAYRAGERWIVYCDNQRQLSAVISGLRAAGCSDALEYHTAMTGDACRTIELFEQRGGVVVSIRCLDEGVDIPSVSHALILASSKNPREYVQRRGRVLRRAPNKSLAHIHDVLVTPRFDPDEPPATAILEGELARAIEFGRHAINPGCITDLERLAIENGLDPQTFYKTGFEDDEDNENGGTDE